MLAGALLKALERPQSFETAAGVPFAGTDVLSLRLMRLESRRLPTLCAWRRADVAWSTLGLATFIGLFAAAIVGAGGTPALRHAVTSQLGAASIAWEALCITPAVAVIALISLTSATRARGLQLI